MTLIAIIEDNDDLRDMTRVYLAKLGYDVQAFEDAEEALSMATSPDIYIVDLNLPDMNGYDLISGIRSVDPAAGIIILSAREHVEDLVKGYDVGADIYLNKPCDPKILLASIKRLEGKGTRTKPSGDTVLEVCSSTAQVVYCGKQARLSEGELRVLRGLAIASKRGLERHELAMAFGIDLETAKAKTLDVRVVRLRSKLAMICPNTEIIQTIRNFGFRVAGNVELRFVT